MAEPGASVREDKDYKKEAADKRKYWETGENDSLTDDQKKKLCELAEQAAKYDRKTKKSGDDYPRSKDKTIDHGALVRNAKEWVYDALQPHRDIRGKQKGHLKLGEIVDGSGTPEKPIDPSGGDTTEPAWVCINCAKLLAGFLRCLDYPVREVSTWLSEGNFVTRTYPYQEGAIQVWFDGKWHYVDAHLCIYDPAKTISIYSDYNDTSPHYWDGTEAPQDWRGGTRADPKWKALSDPGSDLQKRFFPTLRDEHGLFVRPRGEESWRMASEIVRGDCTRSGVFVRMPDAGVALYLMDSDGRITDGIRSEIPGAIHMRAGTPISYSEMLNPEEPVDGPEYEIEWVFVGTQSQIADYEQIGRHEFTLFALGDVSEAHIEAEIVSGDHSVTVEGLPESIDLVEGIGAATFTVIIDPLDPCFHLSFELLLASGLVQPEHYWPATDAIRAIQLRQSRAPQG